MFPNNGPSGRTHPDRLLAQPGAPRHLRARLRRRVVRDLEQRLEPLGLTVGEHRPHPGLLPQVRLRGPPEPVEPAVARPLLRIWWSKHNH